MPFVVFIMSSKAIINLKNIMKRGKKNFANSHEYCVGVLALEAKTEKTFYSLKEAIEEAFNKGLSFVVEFGPSGRRILAWESEVVKKQELIDKYPYDGDKRTILASSSDEFWLVLKTNVSEIIIPISEVEKFKKIDITHIL